MGVCEEFLRDYVFVDALLRLCAQALGKGVGKGDPRHCFHPCGEIVKPFQGSR